MRFYLDEHLSPRIAEIGRGIGLDIVSALEIGPPGLLDEEHLRRAAEDGRTVVTKDHRDFTRLTIRAAQSEASHAGVLSIPGAWPTDQFSRIAHALRAYDGDHPDIDVRYLIDYLRSGPD
jgi:predicted nuclease of predicted toxin-antitoxin system